MYVRTCTYVKLRISLRTSRARRIVMYNSDRRASAHVRKLKHAELISSFELSAAPLTARSRAPLLLNLFQFAGVTYCISRSDVKHYSALIDSPRPAPTDGCTTGATRRPEMDSRASRVTEIAFRI